MLDLPLNQLTLFSLFKDMSLDDIQNTLTYTLYTIKHFKAHEVICTQGSPCPTIGFILEGCIEQNKYNVCSTLIETRFIHQLQSFGENATCSHLATWPYTLEAHCPTTILFIDSCRLFSITAEASIYINKFLTNILNTISTQSITLHNRLYLLSIHSLRKRIALLLLNYYYESGQPFFTLEFNHEELANYLNVTRPAVSKVLSEFKKNGLIDYYQNTFKILNATELANL